MILSRNVKLQLKRGTHLLAVEITNVEILEAEHYQTNNGLL